MTDAQVADERFLVLINDLLASGEIPELIADDEMENLINGVRGEVLFHSMHNSTTIQKAHSHTSRTIIYNDKDTTNIMRVKLNADCKQYTVHSDISMCDS